MKFTVFLQMTVISHFLLCSFSPLQAELLFPLSSVFLASLTCNVHQLHSNNRVKHHYSQPDHASQDSSPEAGGHSHVLQSLQEEEEKEEEAGGGRGEAADERGGVAPLHCQGMFESTLFLVVMR